MSLTTEQLLAPRYKVIADYPQSRFNPDEILIPNRMDGKVDNQWVNQDPNDKRYIHAQLENFPHLFKPLQWWEDREEKDMPEYVKWRYMPECDAKTMDGYIAKVFGWSQAGYGVITDDGKTTTATKYWTPATHTDYTNYQNSKGKT